MNSSGRGRIAPALKSLAYPELDAEKLCRRSGAGPANVGAFSVDVNLPLKGRVTGDSSHGPFSGRELPKNPAAWLSLNWRVVNEPASIARQVRGELNHLLTGRQRRVNGVMGIGRGVNNVGRAPGLRAIGVAAAT